MVILLAWHLIALLCLLSVLELRQNRSSLTCQIRKSRSRNIKEFVQGHVVNWWS